LGRPGGGGRRRGVRGEPCPGLPGVGFAGPGDLSAFQNPFGGGVFPEACTLALSRSPLSPWRRGPTLLSYPTLDPFYRSRRQISSPIGLSRSWDAVRISTRTVALTCECRGGQADMRVERLESTSSPSSFAALVQSADILITIFSCYTVCSIRPVRHRPRCAGMIWHPLRFQRHFAELVDPRSVYHSSHYSLDVVSRGRRW
jgi:hypothetical protein